MKLTNIRKVDDGPYSDERGNRYDIKNSSVTLYLARPAEGERKDKKIGSFACYMVDGYDKPVHIYRGADRTDAAKHEFRNLKDEYGKSFGINEYLVTEFKPDFIMFYCDYETEKMYYFLTKEMFFKIATYHRTYHGCEPQRFILKSACIRQPLEKKHLIDEDMARCLNTKERLWPC